MGGLTGEKKNRSREGCAMDNTCPRNYCPAILGCIQAARYEGPEEMRRRDASTQNSGQPAGCSARGCEQDYRNNCAAIGTTCRVAART